ncbi:MAG: alkaline phosphatase [Acutalibacteraceae bacterium]|nr:alkaline phosphatase [Acutalibacteraceae bacterium]
MFMLAVKSSLSVLLAVLVCISGWFGMTGDKATGEENYKTYKNVILMIGDGMGFNTLEATKKLKNVNLVMETMPVCSQSETRSLTNKVTDSAAGGTALACGVRTYNGAIGVFAFNPFANNWQYPVSLSEFAIERGKAAGVVTTDETSGATPASFSAHAIARTSERNISYDQMESDLTLVWGCASESVTAEKCAENGFDYFTTRAEMNALPEGSRSFGQFNWDDVAAVKDDNDTPYIAEMTEKAIDLLDDDEDGFFLMVEGAHIDKFSHSNDFNGSTSHTAEFDKAIQVALDYAAKDGETLVVVTADHETGGITYNAEKDEYYYTTGSHTGVNVPVFVSATDAGFIDGKAYKNCEVSTQIARIMGAKEEDFPRIKL